MHVNPCTGSIPPFPFSNSRWNLESRANITDHILVRHSATPQHAFPGCSCESGEPSSPHKPHNAFSSPSKILCHPSLQSHLPISITPFQVPRSTISIRLTGSNLNICIYSPIGVSLPKYHNISWQTVIHYFAAMTFGQAKMTKPKPRRNL
jgi:hypothetical protein